MNPLSKTAACLCALLALALFPIQVLAANVAGAATASGPAISQAMPPPHQEGHTAPPPGLQPSERSAPVPGVQNPLPPGPSTDQLAAEGVRTTGEYVLGPGDVITVTDYSATPPAPREMPVLPDGTVNIYPIGVVKAAGMSVAEFNRYVNDLARKYIIEPQIEVIVHQVRPAVVYVLGAVTNPGLYSAHSIGVDPTGFDVNPTVVTALQRAGGLRDDADVRHIVLTRAGTVKIPIDLWTLVMNGDTAQDVALQAGDTIFVPHGGTQFDPNLFGLAANRQRAVRVWGSVQRPGLYDLKPSDDLLSVIATAGGFTNTAVTRNVLLARVNRDGTVFTTKVDVKKSIRDSQSLGRTSVQPGDVVIVADSIAKHAGRVLITAGSALAVGIGLVLASYNFRNRSFGNTANNSNTTTIPRSGIGIGFF